jgi:hypothetical protein
MVQSTNLLTVNSGRPMMTEMAGFTKLFASLVTSTIWQEPLPVKVVWVTMLALADQHGVVGASVPGLASMAGVTLEQCQDALGRFLGPDQFSRTEEHDGRRIEKVPGGWRLLNYLKYREMGRGIDRTEYLREKQRESRARRQPASTNVNRSQKQIAEAEAEAPESDSSAPAEPRAKLVDQFLIFPTVGKAAEWVLTNSQVAAWRQLFPHLDVEQECRAALAWVIANPAKRKTATGVARFLTAWLTRAQDSGRGAKSATPAANGAAARDVRPLSAYCNGHLDRQDRWSDDPRPDCPACKHQRAKYPRHPRVVSMEQLFSRGGQ